jgi:PTS system N-acetylgalactosamine-specific IIA component
MMSSSDAPPLTGPRAIVAGHGEFAPGLVSAVDQITGRGSQLTALVVRGLGAAEIEATIAAAMRDGDVRVVFTDLQAGSCTMAARRILRALDNGVLVAGANLPMLIDFVLGDAAAPVEAARRAADRGRAAVVVHEGVA